MSDHNNNLAMDLRDLLRSVASESNKESTPADAADMERWNPSSSFDESYPGEKKDVSGGAALECNQAQKLIAGHFLVVNDKQCFQLDPESGEFTFLFEINRMPRTFFWSAVAGADGFIYCSLSGEATEPEPQGVASFGNWGAVYRVDHHYRRLHNIGKFIDPFGLQLIGNGKMLVADFESWGKSGKVYEVNIATGEQLILAEGGYLVDPQGVIQDDDGTLWIANAMHNEYDGSVVKVVPGNDQSILYPRHGPGSGIVSGICKHSDPGKIICKVMDWPFMQSSRVLAIDKNTGEVTALLSADADHPKIYGNGTVVDDILWIPESYRKEIIAFDLKIGEVVSRIDASPIAGSVKGVYDSFSFIESVSIIPPQLFGANSVPRVA